LTHAVKPIAEFETLNSKLLSMTWVKICGITNLEDALTAVDAGADALGFVFCDKSPRKVDVETAREIIGKLPARIEKVGVFVNESAGSVSAIADEVGLTAVQFHGDEYQNPTQYAVRQKAYFCLPVIDIVHELKRGGFIGFEEFPNLAGILLDSGTREQRGGTGKTFAWGEAYSFVSTLSASHPVIIAGGLTPTNVGWAAGFLKPFGVDVSSGVEARPGKKDPDKVRAFIEAVRRADDKS
jgi:phosphoribosylanthranilate isomerase